MLFAATLVLFAAPGLPYQGPVPAPAAPEEWPAFSYTYLQLEYMEQNVDGFQVNPDGVVLSGSAALNESFHLFADSAFTRGRALGSSVDAASYSFGLGGHVSLDARTDLFAEVGLVGTEIETSGGTLDDHGLGVRAGVRLWAGRGVELRAGISNADLDGVGGDSSLEFGGVVHVAEHAGLVGNLSLGDEVDSVSVGLRLFR